MNTLLIVHDAFCNSNESVAYISRILEENIGKIANTIQVSETDSTLVPILKSLPGFSARVLIVTSPKSFATVSKILCTENRDTLEAKGSLLIPQKADVYNDAGYLLSVASCRINVIQAEAGTEFPPILLHKNSHEITLNLFGIDADDAGTLLGSIAESSRVRLSSHPHVGGWGVLHAAANTSEDLNIFLGSTQTIFGNKIIAGDNIAEHLVARLDTLKKKISCAESCTGGRIASLLTAVSGSSAVFDGSMVTYANETKAEWLGVNATSLMAYGAVSTAVVEEMAAGILEKSRADYALAVSGVAGPTGGSVEKPVGTVYIACASRENGIRSEQLTLKGDRGYIQIASAYNALRLLIESNYELI